MMGIWEQELAIWGYCQIFSGWVHWCEEDVVLWAGHHRSCVWGGCQDGLRLLSQGKATFFSQIGESHRLSLEAPALGQPEIT